VKEIHQQIEALIFAGGLTRNTDPKIRDDGWRSVKFHRDIVTKMLNERCVKWNFISEKLPEHNGGEYMVALEDGDVTFDWWQRNKKGDGGWWYRCPESAVIAWADLPLHPCQLYEKYPNEVAND
jgi:hypothetical protein